MMKLAFFLQILSYYVDLSIFFKYNEYDLLLDEEKKKLSMDNFEKYLPEQTHVYMNKRIMVSSYTPKWYMKKLKKEYYKK